MGVFRFHSMPPDWESVPPIYKGVDCTGKSFNGWTVLGSARRKPGSRLKSFETRWLCQCACGSDAQWITKGGLTKGNTKGCSKCSAERVSGNLNSNWKGCGEIPGSMFATIRQNAKKRARDIKVEVTLEDLDSLWKAQNRTCTLSGLPLVMGETASLDRIDSSKDYSKDNVQWVHKVVNKMKQEFPQSLFIEMCTHITNHSKQKQERKEE